MSWRGPNATIFQLDASGNRLQASITVEASTPGEVVLGLSLHNPTDRSIATDVSFPRLDGLRGDSGEALHYCFPRQDLILGNKPVSLDQAYGSKFPLQFLSAYQPGKGGVYLITCDAEMRRKRYFLNKAERLDMGVHYPGIVIKPGQTIELPQARLGVYAGDWHHAFDAYRRWAREWYKPAVPRKQWFREVFNFRQVFLYPNLDTPGLFDPKQQNLSIASSIKQDRERFGAVDYVHVFDWSQTPDQGRVGMYDPWHHLPRKAFNEEIEALQADAMPVGLYFEGYLVSPKAELAKRPGRAWQLMNQEGGRYDPFGSGDDYMCPGVSDWREHLTQAVARTAKQTRANGFYIDQLGFGYQYPCHDKTHGHATPSNQPRDEATLIQQVRAALSDEQILYTEQAPVDVATQYQDGSFSYSLLHARNPASPSRTNLIRFAFPEFKTIQILKGDGPIGDDVEGIELVFYNGDGLWLVGPSDNPKWYSPRVLAVIRKTRALRERYIEAFTSADVTPLVPTLIDGVYAHRFQAEEQTVWTLYNATEQASGRAVLRVKHIDGARYDDVWNGIALTPVIRDGWATLSVELGPKGVGCLVRSR